MPAPELILRFAIAMLVGYVLGSTPSGVLVGRLFGNIDPRTQGSGKTGATNILRTLGPGPAALVVVLDVGKGIVAVLLARYAVLPVHAGTVSLTQQALAEAFAGLGALLGHNYSVFIRFTGGRGVATGGGAMLAMSPIAMLIGLLALIVPVAITRYVSLGSILAAAATGTTALALVLTRHDVWPHAAFALIGGAFVILSHHDNIQRLSNGTERKLGQPTQGS